MPNNNHHPARLLQQPLQQLQQPGAHSSFQIANSLGVPTTSLLACCRGHSNGYSELGYGPKGKKSSANPDKCLALEGIKCYQVGPRNLRLCKSSWNLVPSIPRGSSRGGTHGSQCPVAAHCKTRLGSNICL
jgi:hypothetical protein